MADAVNHPQHYQHPNSAYEAIKVIEAWGLGFCLGNTVKYIMRAPHKGAQVEDLKKARWYLDREIARLERQAAVIAELDRRAEARRKRASKRKS
jgi:hypothetical protein